MMQKKAALVSPNKGSLSFVRGVHSMKRFSAKNGTEVGKKDCITVLRQEKSSLEERRSRSNIRHTYIGRACVGIAGDEDGIKGE